MTVPLRLEPLEPRDVPATFGIPWPDGQHLTPSFAPDGTSILGGVSNLNSAPFAHDPDARLAVLRAFQTWSVQANGNVGRVSDSGAAFGPGGEGRSEVRVGVRPLDPTSAPDATVPLSGATPPAAHTAQPSGAPVTLARPTSTAIHAPAPAPREGTAQRIPPGASTQPAGDFVPPIRSRTDRVDRVWYMWWY
jgi:hypothetical protein